MRKRIIRIAASLLLLLGLFLVLLQTSLFQQWLLRRIENFASAAGYSVSASRLDLSLRHLRGSLFDLTFDDRRGTRITAKRVAIDLPWSALNAAIVVVDNLEAEELSIDIQSPEPVVPEPSGDRTEAPRIRFARLVVRNGKLTYTNQSTSVRIPAFALEVVQGRGAIQMGAPITVSPDTTVRIPDIPIVISDTGVDFAKTNWRIELPQAVVSGYSDGSFHWAPALALRLVYATDPIEFQNWKDIQSTGRIGFENGVLKITDFRATSGEGQITGGAEISDEAKSTRVLWNNVNLTPAGLAGITEGNLALRWKASDFSDVAGEGMISVNTREYGRVRADVAVKDARATLTAAANAFDAAINATVETGLDRKLAGTFQGIHRKYGVARLSGSLSGTIDNPRADSRLTVQGASFQNIGPLDGSADISLAGSRVSASAIRADLKNSTIPDGALQVDLNTKSISGRIPEINVNLDDFAAEARGLVKLTVELDGTIQKPAASISGSSEGLDVGGTHIDNAQFAGRLDGNEFQLTELTARQAEARLTASGGYNLDTSGVAAEVHVSDFSVTQIRDLSTVVSLDADVSGTTESPDIEFNGRLNEITYQGQPHGSLTVRGTTGRELTSIEFASDKYNASGTAQVRAAAPFPFSASVTARDTRIQYDPYEATANGTIRASGELQPFKADAVGFDGFSVRGGGVNLSADGSLANGARISGTADLAQLPADGFELAGTARVQAVVTGSIEDPLVNGALETTDAQVRLEGMASPADIRAAIEFTRDQFKIQELRASYAGATASVTGAGAIKGTGEFQFRVDNLRPERLFPERRSSGAMSLEGSVSVDSPSLEGIAGQARVNQLDLVLRGVAIRQVQPVEITLDRNQLLSVRSFVLEGLDTRAAITGNANLRTMALNLDIDADTDLRIIEPFIPDSSVVGRAQTRVAVRGTAQQPDLQGFLNVRGVQLEMAEPPVLLEQTEAEIRFGGDRVEIARAAGKLNGGEFEASGGTGISAGGLQDAAVHLEVRRAQLEYPEGLQSEISSQIDLTGTGSNVQLSGNLDILNAIYSRDIDLSQEIFTRVTSNQSTASPFGPRREPGVLDQIGLNVTVGTPGLVSVANNMANMDMQGSFQARGTVAEPIILGRAAVLEGGELYFGPAISRESGATTERRDRFVIEQGEVNFNNATRTEPDFNFVATHELNNKGDRVLVTLRATGTPQTLRTELTSDDPTLSEPDITLMLLTGRTIEELQAAPLDVAGQQLVGYLSGEVGGYFENMGSALGLDTVRIDPVLLAEEGDEDLSARLTIGKNITRDFSLIYSQNLAGARAQTWIANYDVYKNLVIRGINDSDDNSIRTELRHDMRFGGGPPLPERSETRNEDVLGQVTFEGSSFPVKDLQKEITKPGKPFNVYRMNQDVRELRQFFADRGFLDVKVRAERSLQDGKVDVRFTIEEGSKITFAYNGAKVPRKVQEDIRQIWVRAFAEGPALRDSEDRLRRHFRDEGFLQMKVASRNQPSTGGSGRHYTFDIEPGSKFDDPEWVVKYADADDRDQEVTLNLPEDAGEVMQNLSAIQDQIEFEFQKQGYLKAAATLPELVIDRDAARFEVTVTRGDRYRLGEVTLTGEPSGHPEEHPLPNGEGWFTSEWLDGARRHIIGDYWQTGYNDVQVAPTTQLDDGNTSVHVTFRVDPGPQQMIGEVRIDGAGSTDMDYVLRQFTFEKGDPVDYNRINLTRKKLYDTRLFKRVDIRTEPGPQGYVARVDLNEEAPWKVRYGLAVENRLQTSDREFGITTNVSYGNLFGRGIVAGLSGKIDRVEREARIFGSLPTFFGREISTTAAVFRIRDATQEDEGFIDHTWGFSAQQQMRLKDLYVLSYDYSFKRVDSVNLRFDPENPFDLEHQIFNIARFNGTLSRDTRDDILNATRGSFFSNAFEITPPGVGSSIKFMRNYGQYFRFRQVKEDWVWANAVRVGIAKGFSGQDLIPSEQFTAGGATTLRAFKQDQIATPGNSLIVLNTELRVPLFWRFGGVGFLDVGNVYPTIRELNFFARRTVEGNPVFRYSPGIGLRVATPLVLIRLDLGLNVFPRPGEPTRRWAFGIGQAF